MTSAMTPSERCGYQQICGENGLMMVVACDHRGGMRKVLADTPEAQKQIDEATLDAGRAGAVPATFIGQAETAMQNGASGVIDGRALWKGCISRDAERQRGDRLETIASARLKEIQGVLDRYAGRA